MSRVVAAAYLLIMTVNQHGTDPTPLIVDASKSTNDLPFPDSSQRFHRSDKRYRFDIQMYEHVVLRCRTFESSKFTAIAG